MKNASFAVLCVALTLGITSCQLMDSIFYNADQVKASELDDYTGTPASSKDEAKTAVTAGITSGAIPIAAFSVSGPSGDVIARAFPNLAAAAAQAPVPTASSRSLPNGTLDTATDGSISYTWSSGTKVPVSTNPTVNISGSLTYAVSANAVEKTAENTLSGAMDIDASFEADLQATIGELASAGLVNGQMNLKAKGNASMTGTLTSYAAKGYGAVSMNAGFSLSETNAHKAGKYLVSLKYANSYEFKLTLADIAGSATANVEMAIVVKLYDNNDKFIVEYQFTDADFASAAF